MYYKQISVASNGWAGGAQKTEQDSLVWAGGLFKAEWNHLVLRFCSQCQAPEAEGLNSNGSSNTGVDQI